MTTESNSERATAAAQEWYEVSPFMQGRERPDLAAIILKHFPQPEWVSVQERLPEKPEFSLPATGTLLLANIGYVVPCFFQSDGEFHWFAGDVMRGVLDWCPLPSPPRTAEQEPK